MGSNCCKKSETKTKTNENEVNRRNKPMTPENNNQNVVKGDAEKPTAEESKNVTTKVVAPLSPKTTNTAVKTLFKNKELKNGMKGGKSGYGKVKSQLKAKKKGLTQFNELKDFLFKKKEGHSYVLIESIGSGSYAEVYKAQCPERINRLVAVKAIQLTKDNENYRKNFLREEMELIVKLKHPSIVKHYEMGQANNIVYMIMEYCENGSLTDWLCVRGAFSEQIAWELIRRIIDGIHYMHSMSIAHRDLKLENILLTDKLYPKISDFSYSVFVDEKESQSTVFCGSLPYFAPEILQRRPHNPLPSDIWALGVCFYVMVNDGLPFKINDDKRMLLSQLKRDWDFKKRVQNQISVEFKQMVRKMLEPDISLRATTQQLVENQWYKSPPKFIAT